MLLSFAFKLRLPEEEPACCKCCRPVNKLFSIIARLSSSWRLNALVASYKRVYVYVDKETESNTKKKYSDAVFVWNMNIEKPETRAYITKIYAYIDKANRKQLTDYTRGVRPISKYLYAYRL